MASSRVRARRLSLCVDESRKVRENAFFGEQVRTALSDTPSRRQNAASSPVADGARVTLQHLRDVLGVEKLCHPKTIC